MKYFRQYLKHENYTLLGAGIIIAIIILISGLVVSF